MQLEIERRLDTTIKQRIQRFLKIPNWFDDNENWKLGLVIRIH